MGRVVITDYLYENLDEERRIIEGAGHELIACQCHNEDEVIEACRDADGVIIQYASGSRRVIENCPKLRVISRYGIGYDTVDTAAATEHGVYVANVPDYCLDEVSSHAIALLMTLARGILPLWRETTSGGWDYAVARPVYRMAGRTLGILGYGRIGRLVAHKLGTFGLHILACDPNVSAIDMQQYGVRKVDFDTLLAESDYLTLHLPLSAETHHIIDDAAFAKMKRGVILVNTARGSIVSEAALVRAVEAGIVSGAGIDVTESEPLEQESRLRSLPGVILTPHFAWHSEESQVRLQQSAAEEVVRVLAGGLPKNLVNTEILTRR